MKKKTKILGVYKGWLLKHIADYGYYEAYNDKATYPVIRSEDLELIKKDIDETIKSK